MTVSTKQAFVEDVALDIGDFLTVTQTNKVSEVIEEKLIGYELTERNTEVDSDSLDLLKIFLDSKRIEGRSEKTIDRYSYILERMIREIGTPVNKMTVFHLRGYLMDLKNQGLQASSLEGIRSVMSSYFGWLWKENLIPTNPCANIGSIKSQKKIRHPYSAVDIQKLKDGCKSQRDKAIISFLLSTGARISEVCSLNRDDIDFTALECTVLGKGNKQRTVYLDEVTAMELNNYLERRTDKSWALFSGKGTERMTPHGVRKMLDDLGKATGVENVHPHRFRRTLATNLINHGMPIQEVAMILGHENINTTMKYVYLDKNNVKNSYKKYA